MRLSTRRFARSPGVALVLVVGASMLAAQRGTAVRRVATVPNLVAHAVFYHSQPVKVLGNLVTSDPQAWQLFTNDKSLLLLVRPTVVSQAPSSSAEAQPVVLTGTFYDVGRLEQNDTRLTGFDLVALSQRVLRKDWPGIGELPLLLVDSIASPDPAPARPSIRSIALEPERYADEAVTLVGRFRGRNLFGDLPDGPGRSQWDFVLHLADSAVWITGLRPRGKGFELRLDSRLDTGRWLQVSGVVRSDGRRVWVEGQKLELAEAPEESTAEVAVEVPTVGPRPEVIFSDPSDGETDILRTASVRIQFSRDMDPASFKGNVRVGYLREQSVERGEPEQPPIESAFTYDDSRRMLEIRFRQDMDRFRTVRVELGEGVKARDGAALVPWTVSFNLGG